MTNQLPIIDLAAFFEDDAGKRRQVAAMVDAVCRDTGFLLIKGHGVPLDVIHRMHDVSAKLFAQPLDYKRRLEVPAPQDIGWKGPELSYLAETLTPGVEGANAQDWKEGFGIGPLHVPDDISPDEAIFFTENVYPESPAGFREAYEEYYTELEKLSDLLLQIFASSLGLEDGYFKPKTDRHISQLVVNYYPAQDSAPAAGQLRAGAHTDFGTITILNTGNDPGGLQVLGKNGEWQDVVVTPDLFVVNLGDLMAQWTNDRWVSTLHRVVNPVAERAHMARQSIAFFVQLNWHTVIECLPTCSGPDNPPKYAPVISGAHIALKLARLRGIEV